MKLPFVKFFPRDWMGDDRLRLCSLPARGLWIDLLCLMHSSPRRGYLQTATGSPLPLEQIARMTGCSTDEATLHLRELIDSGTCDCTEHGMIYSRRMVREESKREKCSQAGKQGGGNPTFKGQSKGGDKGSPKRNPKPQSLRGADTQREETPNPLPDDDPLPVSLRTPAFRKAWESWVAYRAEKRKKLTSHAADLQLRKLAEFGPEWSISRIEKAIMNSWSGLVFDDDAPGRTASGNHGPIRPNSRVESVAGSLDGVKTIVCGTDPSAEAVPREGDERSP